MNERTPDERPEPVTVDTPLQRSQGQLLRVFQFARELLDEDTHRLFVEFAAAVVAREAARDRQPDRRLW